MSKVRVYELARELEQESKDVLARAQELGLAVKTASSGLAEDEAELVRMSYQDTAASQQPADSPQPAEVSQQDEAPADDASSEMDAASTDEATDADETPEPATKSEKAELIELTVTDGITPEEFGPLVDQTPAAIVGALIGLGEMVAANGPIPVEAIELLGEQYNAVITVEQAEAAEGDDDEEAAAESAVGERRTYEDDEADLQGRPPVVTVMGHVDHGKTTLLDKIRSTNVVSGEAGGITQHIGAYQVTVNGNLLTFLDTPGHEAFTALRARGAEVTDIVVLVVAADDGLMPQTIEAISHSKAAGVPIIVAINKMDLPGADPNQVRAQLTEYELVAEELGGDITTVELSAITGEGIDNLLEVIDLVAQLEEFKANPEPLASGVVIESQRDKGMGAVATIIVQRGTLRVRDPFVAGTVSGRVRAMRDHTGAMVKEAPPSTPVLVQGWDDVPTAGDPFDVKESEREARSLAEAERQREKDDSVYMPTARERLEALLEQLRTADEAELRLIIKADAHGSLEALRESIAKIGRQGGTIRITHSAVGAISENDVSLAEVTESVIVGFNVRPDGKARRAAEQQGIEIRTYQIIYELLEEIEALLVGRLAPDEVEQVLGSAEVREVFKVPRAGNIAGSFITEGEMRRGAKARLLRDGIVVYTGEVSSLRRFKDDVRNVASGFECGIGLSNFNDIKEGDVIEAFEVREVART